MALRLAAAAAALLAGTARALDTLPVHARGGKLWADLKAREAAAHELHGVTQNLTASYFAQSVWHNGSTATFQQKYYFDASAWTKAATAPVIFYISGEGPCGSSPGGYTAVVGKSLGALLVTMEHRCAALSPRGAGESGARGSRAPDFAARLGRSGDYD